MVGSSDAGGAPGWRVDFGAVFPARVVAALGRVPVADFAVVRGAALAAGLRPLVAGFALVTLVISTVKDDS